MEAARLEVVLDASAVIALALDEPSASRIRPLLQTANARMATVNAAEVVDVLTRVHGVPADDVVARVEVLLTTVVDPVDASLHHALRAGALRARHWRRDQRVSLADCFALATAEPGGRIVTTDGQLAVVAQEEGIQVVALD